MKEMVNKNNIEDMIYEIRGVQVMLDSDLAKLYGCKNGTKSINQAINRNADRFPNDFYFQITEDEKIFLRIQNESSTLSEKSRTLPYVFTEQGVAMLATILKTDIASKISIEIMRAFVKMRHYIHDKNVMFTRIIAIENKVDLNSKRIDKIFDLFNKTEFSINNIFFEGQIYDSYSLLIDIFSKAKTEIVIIDNYASKELLDILKNINVSIKIVSKNIDDTLRNKYESQYNNVRFITNNSFHDRFIIIDEDILYHSGSSFKDLGKKCFCLSIIEDKNYLSEILKKAKV